MHGYSVISLKILVNSSGNPVFWTNPVVMQLEPRMDIDIQDLMNKLDEKQLAALLHIIVES